MKELNPYVWFGNREVNPIPRHFVKTSTPHTTESYFWVLTTLVGRYGIANLGGVDLQIDGKEWGNYFYFEDPADAMMYELRWSGIK